MVIKLKRITLNDCEYEVIKDFNQGLDMEDLKDKLTDYFIVFDYIVGDYSYDKLRLKGFYDEKSKEVKDFNNYKNVDNYISEYCSYQARSFILKKIKKAEETLEK